MGRAAHPKLHKGWRETLRIINDTEYDTRTIRKLVAAALRAIVLPVRGAVRIAYSSESGGDARHRHHGSAAMGRTTRREDGSFATLQGLTMALTLPRKPEELDVGLFARVILHEALHWKGVEHREMTENQLWCTGPTPAWAADVSLPHAVRARPNPVDLRAKRLKHAETMLERAEAKERRWNNIASKWKRKASALRRALEKTEA